MVVLDGPGWWQPSSQEMQEAEGGAMETSQGRGRRQLVSQTQGQTQGEVKAARERGREREEGGVQGPSWEEEYHVGCEVKELRRRWAMDDNDMDTLRAEQGGEHGKAGRASMSARQQGQAWGDHRELSNAEWLLQAHRSSALLHPLSALLHPSPALPHPFSALIHPFSALPHPSSALTHPFPTLLYPSSALP